MIDDQEMRELFRVEAAEHLQGLEAGLLRLESEPTDKAALAEAFREIHSMKGAARMLGLRGIETLSHAMEEVLSRVHRDEIAQTRSLIDGLCRGLDGMRKMVAEALSGEPAGVALVDLLNTVKAAAAPTGTSAPPSRFGTAIRAEEPEVSNGGTLQGMTPPATPAHPEDQPRSEASGFETIRVETRKLDRLLDQAGELTVTSMRIAQHVADLEDLLDLLSRQRTAGSGLSAAKSEGRVEEVPRLLAELRGAFSADSSRLDSFSAELTAGIQDLRLLPLITIFRLFPLMVRDLARERERECHLTLDGGETVADKRILEELKDPLMHLIRNAIDHGIEPPAERRTKGKPPVGTIVLRAYQSVGQVVVEVEDDGRGLDLERIRQSASKSRRWRLEDLATMPVEQLQELVFVSGLSTSNFVSDVSGRGVGLDVVRTNVERLKGTISVASRPGAGSTFRIRVPVTLVTARVVVVSAGGLKYALPMEFIAQCLLLRRHELFTLEGRTAIQVAGEPLAVARLADLLVLNRNDFLAETASNQQSLSAEEWLSCLIIKVDGERFALLVDDLSEDQEVKIKPTGDFLEQISGISGTTILGGGEVCPVLQPRDLLPALGRQAGLADEETGEETPAEKKLLLLVEDSLTTRTRMKRILEGGGYEVVTAVDGVDAMSKLGTRRFDGLVSDISMPNMDGLTLTAQVRQLKRYAELPIILVTMLASEEDKMRGMEAGANAYIAKPAFDQKLLLDTLRRLV